jgi:hypothetical protein
MLKVEWYRAGEAAKGKNISATGVERKKGRFGSLPKQKAPARLFYLVNLGMNRLPLNPFTVNHPGSINRTTNNS